VVLALVGALMSVVTNGVSAVPARPGCRPTAFVTNLGSGTLSTVDVKTRTKKPIDITVGTSPFGVAVTPDGKTAFVTNFFSGSVSIDIKTRTKNPTDIPVGSTPAELTITPDGKTAFVTSVYSNTVSTIDVKTRTKHPTDIPVGTGPVGVVAGNTRLTNTNPDPRPAAIVQVSSSAGVTARQVTRPRVHRFSNQDNTAIRPTAGPNAPDRHGIRVAHSGCVPRRVRGLASHFPAGQFEHVFRYSPPMC
jgi:YVTN family beta-propeller protein